ncbi:hypothetical protein ACIBQ2_03485 [Micromonospora sediminimaris]|uniref:hypothetical protein n=1 Tax=Micromonospora sediminimaris TaxID=547162 RepID=UPI0037B358B3
MNDTGAAGQALDDAIENVYALFARHQLPADLTACDHCVSPEEVDLFRRTPLRQLTPDQLGVYLLNPGTFGDDTEFPHLLPRLLELYARDQMDGWSSPDAVTRRISSQWRDWSAAERAAVTRLLATWWRHMLHTFGGPNEAWYLLDAVLECGVDLTSYLAAFTEVGEVAAARHLADVIDWCVFSTVPDDDRSTFQRWLAGDEPLAVLDAAATHVADPAAAREISRGREQAETLRGWLREKGLRPD